MVAAAYAAGMKPLPTCALLAAALAATPVFAQSKAPPTGLTLDLRLRSESVDDAAFAKDADATTLRVRAGCRLPLGTQWRGLVELEHTSHLGAEQFNSSANGRSFLPTI